MEFGELRRTYRWMAHIYDRLFERFYRGMRAANFRALAPTPSDTVLLVGVGTGLDLPHLPPIGRALALDVSPEMLVRARHARSRSPVDCIVADGARVPVRDGSVDAIVCHLVLCSGPDGRALLAEAARVVRIGGRVAIIDHFAPHGRLPLWRRVASRAPALLGTHLDRPVEPMLAGLPFVVREDRRWKRGLYRSLLLERVSPGD